MLDKKSVKCKVSMGSGNWERLLLLRQLECSILNRFFIKHIAYYELRYCKVSKPSFISLLNL